MSLVRAKDTKPEMRVRKLVHSLSKQRVARRRYSSGSSPT